MTFHRIVSADFALPVNQALAASGNTANTLLLAPIRRLYSEHVELRRNPEVRCGLRLWWIGKGGAR